ncbi:MAG TPA: TrkA family potassium uptake protein [Candidatus Acidoferrales bacterium]|nr:TrkA family potassium uptake protein [Candidatus Acidoferrales bacterium]
MYAIVVGGGKVGYYLSRDLLERGHEVTLVEKDGSRAEWLESQLGSIVMRGDGDELAFLSTTGIERADAVLAVTGDDEDNLVALQLAKKRFNVPLTIARVNNPANVEIFKTLGVDQAVSATEVLLGALENPISE